MNLNLNKTENQNEIENYLNALRKYIVEDNEKFVTYLSYLLYLRNTYDSENLKLQSEVGHFLNS